VPHIIRACLLSLTGFTQTLPSSSRASTLSLSLRLSSPSLPFAESRRSAISTVTPLGTATGFLPTRDIVLPQNTRHSTSPPTLAARASLSDSTPRGVDRIEIPSPL